MILHLESGMYSKGKDVKIRENLCVHITQSQYDRCVCVYSMYIHTVYSIHTVVIYTTVCSTYTDACQHSIPYALLFLFLFLC
jgi:hypothetical protein